MPRIFLSYRRDDSQDITGRVYDRLVSHFGRGSVFLDIDSIPVGVDYRAYLSDWISQCDAVVVVIGAKWLGPTEAGEGSTPGRRIDDPNDFVRIEVAAALARDIPVIPLLVNGTAAPSVSELPGDVVAIAFRNGMELRSGRDFHGHVDQLIASVERVLGTLPAAAAESVPGLPAVAVRPPASPVPSPLAASVPSVSWPTNLGFEDGDSDGMPIGWSNGLFNVDGVSRFPVKVVPRDSGRCVQIRKVRGDVRSFGTVMQRCPATPFRGKALRLEADLKCERLQRWAGIWLRIDGPAGQLFFDRRSIRGSQPWSRHRIETRVTEDASWLNYGVLLIANGTVWADDFALTVDAGPDVFMIDFERPA
jgi:hypothetical protein